MGTVPVPPRAPPPLWNHAVPRSGCGRQAGLRRGESAADRSACGLCSHEWEPCRFPLRSGITRFPRSKGAADGSAYGLSPDDLPAEAVLVLLLGEEAEEQHREDREEDQRLLAG